MDGCVFIGSFLGGDFGCGSFVLGIYASFVGALL